MSSIVSLTDPVESTFQNIQGTVNIDVYSWLKVTLYKSRLNLPIAILNIHYQRKVTIITFRVVHVLNVKVIEYYHSFKQKRNLYCQGNKSLLWLFGFK